MGRRCPGERIKQIAPARRVGQSANHMVKVIKVLLVDDDRDFNETVTDFLTVHGYKVKLAEDGVAALRAVMAEDFDVLLVDMAMPNMPGDVFHVALQRVRPHLCERVIFITAHIKNPKVNEFLAEVGGTVLCKPFHVDDLLVAILEQLAKTQSIQQTFLT